MRRGVEHAQDQVAGGVGPDFVLAPRGGGVGNFAECGGDRPGIGRDGGPGDEQDRRERGQRSEQGRSEQGDSAGLSHDSRCHSSPLRITGRSVAHGCLALQLPRPVRFARIGPAATSLPAHRRARDQVKAAPRTCFHCARWRAMAVPARREREPVSGPPCHYAASPNRRPTA